MESFVPPPKPRIEPHIRVRPGFLRRAAHAQALDSQRGDLNLAQAQDALVAPPVDEAVALVDDEAPLRQRAARVRRGRRGVGSDGPGGLHGVALPLALQLELEALRGVGLGTVGGVGGALETGVGLPCVGGEGEVEAEGPECGFSGRGEGGSWGRPVVICAAAAVMAAPIGGTIARTATGAERRGHRPPPILAARQLALKRFRVPRLTNQPRLRKTTDPPSGRR